MPAQADVVVFDEQHLSREARIAHERRNLLENRFSRDVVGMRFAGEHELNRHLRIAHERGDRLDVPQNQIRPLVGREPARETDGERVQAQGVPHLGDKIRRFAPALGLPGRQPARDLDELRFQRLMRFPELTVVDGVDAIPEVRRTGSLRPVRPQMTVVRPGASGGRAMSARARRW